MLNRALLVLTLSAGATSLHAQAIIEYGAASVGAAGAGAAGGIGKSTSKIFDKVNASLAGAAKTGEPGPRSPSLAPTPATVTAVTSAPAPVVPAAPPDLTALVVGMDRADLFKKVGKPSMVMSSMESSKVIETCWYKNGAQSVTVIVRDGKVTEISGLEQLAAK